MEEWAANSKNKKHSFYGTYQHMKYKGYTHILPWENICQIMHVTIVGQYVEFVTQCPAVSSNYRLLWDTRENHIQYRWHQTPSITKTGNARGAVNLYVHENTSIQF